jgi:hypothetical protein
MRISFLKLADSNDNLAMGQRIQDVCQWPIGTEPMDRHFDRYASKEFRAELRKQLKKSAKRVGSQIIEKL